MGVDVDCAKLLECVKHTQKQSEARSPVGVQTASYEVRSWARACRLSLIAVLRVLRHVGLAVPR